MIETFPDHKIFNWTLNNAHRQKRKYPFETKDDSTKYRKILFVSENYQLWQNRPVENHPFPRGDGGFLFRSRTSGRSESFTGGADANNEEKNRPVKVAWSVRNEGTIKTWIMVTGAISPA